MPRKYHVHVKGAYIGTVTCTYAELKAALPCSVLGGAGYVDVWAPPPR
jgi:hypothetical protein